MKIFKNLDKNFIKNSLFAGAVALLVSVLAILFCYAIYHQENVNEFWSNISKIFSPIFSGLIIAFLLTPVVNFFERKFFPLFQTKKAKAKRAAFLQNLENLSEEERKKYNKKKVLRFKIIRALSIALTLILVSLLVYSFIYSVFPQIRESVENIVKRSGTYYKNVQTYLSNLAARYPKEAAVVERNWNYYYDDIIKWRDNVVIPAVQEWFMNAYTKILKGISAVWNIIIGLIISIYIIASKEKLSAQFKKVFFAIFSTENANRLIKNLKFANDKFSGFIVGKIIDSLIIGIITLICCFIFKFDYPVLIALIVGVSNLIPFFGPIFGAIPCIVLLFMINPIKALWFLLFIVVLQLFDGNVLGPKILGDSTGVSGLWVIVSITIFGGIWGVPGMIIGVPLFAVLYAAFKTIIEKKLEEKKLSKETKDYIKKDILLPENIENDIIG